MNMAFHHSSSSGLLLGALGAGAVYYLMRRWQQQDRAKLVPAAAFAGPGAAVGSAAQVRDAGPDHMRDDMEEWDNVDEASDQSFPASDPPAKY